jgi:hypothetical protein
VRALLAALLLHAGAALGAPAKISAVRSFSKTGYDELAFLGWNDACSCALQYQRYPPAGQQLQGVPDGWRLGAASIAPAAKEMTEKWVYRSEPGFSWDPDRAAAAIAALQRAGYTRAGFVEAVRAGPTGRTDLETSLRSPAPLAQGQTVSWPKPPFALRQVFYSPLAVCALAVFKNEASPRDSFRWKLVRLLDPGVRRARARAHLENGLLAYDNADIYAAAEETGIAAAMMPDMPSARYQNARMLATHGRFDESLAELEAAIRLDPVYKKEARGSLEFGGLKKDLRFQDLTR